MAIYCTEKCEPAHVLGDPRTAQAMKRDRLDKSLAGLFLRSHGLPQRR
jgi:hypothetical protein